MFIRNRKFVAVIAAFVLISVTSSSLYAGYHNGATRQGTISLRPGQTAWVTVSSKYPIKVSVSAYFLMKNGEKAYSAMKYYQNKKYYFRFKITAPSHKPNKHKWNNRYLRQSHWLYRVSTWGGYYSTTKIDVVK